MTEGYKLVTMQLGPGVLTAEVPDVKSQPTTEERLLKYINELPRDSRSADERTPHTFLCAELDDIRGQLAKAQRQLGMLGLPEPAAEGECEHRKVYSGVVVGWDQAWICSKCLEEGSDSSARKGPSYNELVAKKKEQSR